jgi:hypothetical protein
VTKYRIVVRDNGPSPLKKDPLRYMAKIQVKALFGWTDFPGMRAQSSTEDGAIEAVRAGWQRANTPSPPPRIIPFDGRV